MSVVAAKVYADKISIAADSIVCRGHSKRTDSNFQKLEKVNDMIIGSVGSAQECSLMFNFCRNHKPLTNEERDILAFIIEFSEYIDSPVNNDYILIFEGKCFAISGLFVKEVVNYEAIGAGMDFATSALHLGHSPKDAVKTACELSCFVAEPVIEFEVSR